MQDTSGFYKNDNGELLFAPNFVEGPTFALYRNNKDEYEYPTMGWRWFDSEQEARTFLNLPVPPQQNEQY